MSNQIKFAYFGGEPIGTPVLNILLDRGLKPELVITNPDRPSGRRLELTPPPVKTLAEVHNIPVFQPESLKDRTALAPLTSTDWDLFVVVAYNHIMPTWLIELPAHQTINLHPSLLPKLRGPSPIRTAILEDVRNAVGVSIMLMDAKMDHGPLLAQQPYPIADSHWPIDGQELDTMLAAAGGELLADTIPLWLAGKLNICEQDHVAATYTKKLTKELGALELDPHNLPSGQAAIEALRKIRGLSGWPGTFFFYKNKRVRVIDATLGENEQLKIHRVTPEGKRPMNFSEYLQSITAST